MTDSGRARRKQPLRRALVGLLVVGAVGGGASLGAVLASVASQPGSVAAASRTPTETPAIATLAPSPPPTPRPTPEPTPEPTPRLVAAPLTGLLVSPEDAVRHPIAVMIDDHKDARPQGGFNAAAVVWQAPAEAGIPRYMLIFQDTVPGLVGPVRSARQYYVDWAAEWNAVYVHVGGEPGALATLRSDGDGRLVWNVEERLYEGTYLWRTTDRRVPHNVYSDGDHLRQLAAAIGAADVRMAPAWSFGRGARTEIRPIGAMLAVSYGYETITYRYDAPSNTYRRFIDRATEPQVDAADGQVVAPSNVVVLRMQFGLLNDGHPEKGRLDAEDIGSGEAIISTNGRIIRGSWRKDSVSGPTLLYAADGTAVTLTRGQTFVQVITLSDSFELGPGVAVEDGIGPR